MELDQKQRLYHLGFLEGEFEHTEALSQLIKVCEEIKNKKIKSKYRFVEKYPNTCDLKPCPIDYDECFLQVLKENNIDKVFQTCVGEGINLNNLQVRIAYSAPNGEAHNYMPWHRDNYVYYDTSETAGFLPPGYKLIYYPNLGNKCSENIALIPGSHLQVKFNKSEDFSQTFSYAPIKFKANKNKYIIFNTSIMHGTLPVDNIEGEIRVIYNFTHKMHIDSQSSMQINKKYEEHLND